MVARGGRRPRPTALKLVAGDPKSRINDDEPQPQEGIPMCPSDDRLVRDIWHYTIDQLQTMRVLTLADRDALVAFCEAVAVHRRASKILAEEGAFITLQGLKTPTVAHPALKVQREANVTIRQFAAEFGLTPSARTRIKVGAQKPAEGSGPGRLLSS